LFTTKTLKDILEIKKETTFFNVLKRLLTSEVLSKIERNKYLLNGIKTHDFVLANFIYTPSYISFETALNYYGILSQFPHEIISVTSRKTTQKIINDKSFVYIHIKKDLFWGYEKREEFVIALPEKALLDQIYLAAKGLKSLNLEEYDFSLIDFARYCKFLNNYPKTKQFCKYIGILEKNLK
jgi:predicted transcriptional regulator of viral defense system